MLIIITISTFVCISLGMLGVYWLLYKPQSAATERLRRLGGGKEGIATQNVQSAIMPDERPAAEFAERLASPLNKLLPPSATEARKTQKLLMQAGYRSPEAPIIYRGIHLASMAGLPVLSVAVNSYLGNSFSTVLMSVMLAFVTGFFMPPFFLKRAIKKRQRDLRWGLADALDLMVVSVEAGLGLNAAMMKVASELKDVHVAVATEFELANLEIRVGRERDEALRNLAERTGVEDLRSLVAMLIQTDRFGTSIAKGLRVFSDSLRTKRRQRAEQEAQKAAVKLLFPLACFLFPTLFIAILGPAALNLMDVLARM
ncbi:MAG TPA: type II secretion system F family protein [Pyrinomonadaceae bacterium]|jgi:tight adherence protein C|nr:type II secretion system F family protein [Pyrinomonadaceae bacterium]